MLRIQGKNIQMNAYGGFHIDMMSHGADKNFSGSPPHIHDLNEMMLAKNGVSTIITDNNIIRLRAPYIIHIPAGMTHSQINERALPYLRYCMLYSAADIVGEASPVVCGFMAIELTDEEYARLDSFMSLLLRFDAEDRTDGDMKKVVRDRRARYMTLSVLNELSPMAYRHAANGVVSGSLEYITDVCAFISENRQSKLTIDMIAEKFYISRSKLTRDFRAALGMSVCDYITMERVNYAKLLIGDGMRISDVAYQCGFSSPSYFTDVFTGMNGCSPKEYRRQLSDTGAVGKWHQDA